VAQTVIGESAFNDATGAIATFAVLVCDGQRRVFFERLVDDLLKQAGFGLLVVASMLCIKLSDGHHKFVSCGLCARGDADHGDLCLFGC